MKIFLGLFAAILLGMTPLVAQPTCDRAADSLQLLDLATSTNFGQWDPNMPIDTWYGVLLTTEGCVKVIDFNGASVNGTLSDLDLPFLEVLDFNGQFNLTGPIPDLQLPNLRKLDANFCNFSGAIPNFSGLPMLEKLDLFYNSDLTSVPNFTDLPSLTHLNLSEIIINSVPAFDSLPALEFAFLANINVGNMSYPTFASSTNLRHLDLEGNGLYLGPVPDFSNFPQLTHLNISAVSSNEDLYFENPASLSNLTYLRADYNAFTFDDLLPFANVDTFLYSQQNPSYVGPTVLQLGDSINLLPIDTALTTNTYYWYKDNVLIDSTNSPWLWNASFADSGVYYFLITNPALPDLTLECSPFPLSVVAPTPGGSQVSPTSPQMIAAGNTPVWVVMSSDFGNLPAGMGYAYALTDPSGVVLRIFEGDSVDISSAVAGSFRVYGFGAVLPSPVAVGSNLLLLSDSLASVTRSSNYLPVEVGGAMANEADIQAPFSFSPNPTTDYLNLTFPATAAVQWQVRLLDLQGKLLWEETHTGQTPLPLEVSQYPAGTYLLQVSDGQQQWTQRWVKTDQ